VTHHNLSKLFREGGQFDMGLDGNAGSKNISIPTDEFAYSLQYFNGDYSAVNKDLQPFTGIGILPPLLDGKQVGNQLYNGNISSMTVQLPVLNQKGDDKGITYGYSYDQLNRLTGMNAYKGWNPDDNSFTPITNEDYKERIGYDGNGNILTYLRNGAETVKGQEMDDMNYRYNYYDLNGIVNSYSYKSGIRVDAGGNVIDNNKVTRFTNQLNHVNDNAVNSQYTEDIKDQATDNYKYDEIGNLIKDDAEGITNIVWNVYGKIESISKTKNDISTNIIYGYDATGNRISKTVQSGDTTKGTYYVRDGSGNVMSVYTSVSYEDFNKITQSEVDLYGSSRLGIDNVNRLIFDNIANAGIINDTTQLTYGYWGHKQYEGNNHLGNNLITFADYKIGIDNNNDGIIDYYKAVVLSASDYYPGGMALPGRSYNAGNSSYRYGFNGQEKSDELDNGLYTAQFWEYDSRIGRRWNVEPLIAKYPNLSSYVVLNNNPIIATDPDGKDVIFVNGYRGGKTGSAYNRDQTFQNNLKTTYWNNVNKGFTQGVEKYFNDGLTKETEHFVTGDHWGGTSAESRINEGKEVGIKMVSSGEIKVSNTNNVMTIVMHSQGNAEGLGIAEGIIEQAKKQGVNVTVNLVFLSVHQPEGINSKLSADLAKRGIQFTYANDNSEILQPQAKQTEVNSYGGQFCTVPPSTVPDLKGVADANAGNKNWKTDGLNAHSATIDDTGAFEAIKKTDKEKKIFKRK